MWFSELNKGLLTIIFLFYRHPKAIYLWIQPAHAAKHCHVKKKADLPRRSRICRGMVSVTCSLFRTTCWCCVVYIDFYLFGFVFPSSFFSDFTSFLHEGISSSKGLKLCSLKFVSDFMTFSGKIQDFPQFVACSDEEWLWKGWESLLCCK